MTNLLMDSRRNILCGDVLSGGVKLQKIFFQELYRHSGMVILLQVSNENRWVFPVIRTFHCSVDSARSLWISRKSLLESIDLLANPRKRMYMGCFEEWI